MRDAGTAPIVKIIRKRAPQNHSTAWKIAYADFVTALMAFFLLLWLYSVTTPVQKQALADYFTPTTGLKDALGIGFQGGKSDSSRPGKTQAQTREPGMVSGNNKRGDEEGFGNASLMEPDTDGDVASGQKAAGTADAPRDEGDSDAFMAIDHNISQALQSDNELKDALHHVVITEMSDGLHIDFTDSLMTPLFTPGTSELTDRAVQLLETVCMILRSNFNTITITGHMNRLNTKNPEHTAWEMSSERANAVRRLLVSKLDQRRIRNVEGMADRQPLLPDDPENPRNRRITITLMRGSYVQDATVVPTTRSLLSVPDLKNNR